MRRKKRSPAATRLVINLSCRIRSFHWHRINSPETGCLASRFYWLLKNGEFSALVECDEWIHLTRSSCWKIARDHCDSQENERRSDKTHRIVSTNAIQELG